MSGKKISEMTAITGAQLDQTNDVVPILDVSDTSNPNKKISIQELASALGGTTNVSLVLDGSNNLILTDSDGNNVTADLSSLLDDTNTTNASLSLVTNTLTLTDSAGDSVDVDLSSLDNSGLTLADVTANGNTCGAITINDSLSDLIYFQRSGINAVAIKSAANVGSVSYFSNNSLAYSTGINSVSDDEWVITKGGTFSGSPNQLFRINDEYATFTGTSHIQLTSGTTAQRPVTPANGMIRYNSDDDVFEGYAGGAWEKTSGLTLADVTANGAVTGDGIECSKLDISGALPVLDFNDTDASTADWRIQAYDNAYILKNKSTGATIYRVDTLNKVRFGNFVAINSAIAPSVTLDIQGTDAVQLTAGTTAERPTTPANGMIRYNSDDDVFEGYAGGAWGEVVQADSVGSVEIKDKSSGRSFVMSGSTTGTVHTFESSNTAAGYVFKNNAKSLLTTTTTGVSINTNNFPSVTLDINGTDAVQLTAGTEAERPSSPANGMIRYNSDDDVFEGYAGGAWGEVVSTNASGEITNTVFNGTASVKTHSFKRGTVDIVSINGDNDVGSLTYMSSSAASYSIGVDDSTNNIFKVTTGNRASSGDILFHIDKTNKTAGFDTLTASLKLPQGTTAERPTTPANGMIRYNSDDDVFEGYAGGAWEKTSGLTLADVTANGAVTNNAIVASQLTVDNSSNSFAYQFFINNSVNYRFGVASNSFLIRDTNNGANPFTVFSGNNDGAVIIGSTGRIGLGKFPNITLDIQGTDAVQLTSGTTAERPTAAAGMIRFNTTTSKFEGYDGTSWIDLN